jgi:serine/threonine protein kinase
LEGRYVLKKKISQGGFGKVYLAIDKVTKHEVVIKVNSEKDINYNEFVIMKDLSDKNISGFPKVYSQGLIQN